MDSEFKNNQAVDQSCMSASEDFDEGEASNKKLADKLKRRQMRFER